MGFPEAMRLVLDGGSVRRSDWHRPAYVRLERLGVGGTDIVCMTMKNGVIGPWTPSHCDFFATDWTAVQSTKDHGPAWGPMWG